MDSALPGSTPVLPHEAFRRQPLDGQAFKQLVEAGLTWLRTNQQIVNALNVFPVPDGDTGTNMVLTMQAACDEIASSHERSVGKIVHSVAHGALMGARGNSGVILSQLWRGFARALDNHDTLDGPGMVRALVTGKDTAYKGVVRPVEGTILTVAKDSAAAAELALEETHDPLEILARVVPAADESVQRTPDLLPVLKDAGVVDAGGKGLFYILEGMLRFINGLPLDTALATVQPLAMMKEAALEAVEPGQDYEVVIDFHPHGSLDIAHFYKQLEQIGTSIQIGEGDGMYRMHIHVPADKYDEPRKYIETLGAWTKIAAENLMEQMKGLQQKPEEEGVTCAPLEPGQIAVVVVSPGLGISRVFASLSAAAIVEGGQTMNPSTQEILKAFEDLPTEHIILLPNNKNIIMAARSAAEVSTKKVAVVPSRSIPQGLSAIFRYIPDADFDSLVEEMTGALEDVQTGEITTATRTVEIDGVQVQEGQTIGLLNGKLVISAPSVEAATLGLLEKANAADYEKLTFFYGGELPEAELNRIIAAVRQAYPDTNPLDERVEVKPGGQPYYQFIIAIE